MTLTLGDYGVIGGMLLAFCGAITFTARAQTRRIEVVELQVVSKVSHDDWVRVMGSLQNRQEQMSGQLSELIGKVDGSIGMTGAMNRLADAMTKQAQRTEGGR